MLSFLDCLLDRNNGCSDRYCIQARWKEDIPRCIKYLQWIFSTTSEPLSIESNHDGEYEGGKKLIHRLELTSPKHVEFSRDSASFVTYTNPHKANNKLS